MPKNNKYNEDFLNIITNNLKLNDTYFAEILTKYPEKCDTTLLHAIVKHPNATDQVFMLVLTKYLDQCDFDLLYSMVEHFNVTDQVFNMILTKCLEKCDMNLLYSIAAHKNAGAKVLKNILKHQDKFNDSSCFIAMALNFNSTDEVLKVILDNSIVCNDKDLLVAIALNPNISAKTFEIMLQKYWDNLDKDCLLLIAKEANLAVLPIIVENLYKKVNDIDLLCNVMLNQNVTPEIFKLILNNIKLEEQEINLEFIFKNMAQHQDVTPKILINILKDQFFKSSNVDKRNAMIDCILNNKNHLVFWDLTLLEELKSIDQEIYLRMLEKVKENSENIIKLFHNTVFPFMGNHNNSSFKEGNVLSLPLIQDWLRATTGHVKKIPEAILVFNKETAKIESKQIAKIYEETVNFLNKRRINFNKK